MGLFQSVLWTTAPQTEMKDKIAATLGICQCLCLSQSESVPRSSTFTLPKELEKLLF